MRENSTDSIISLDEVDKLIIIAVAAVFLLFILFCLVCALNPDCYLHKHCPFQYDGVNEKTPLQPINGAVYHAHSFTERKGIGGRAPQGQKWNTMVPLRESELSDWSDFSDIIEMKREKGGKRKWSRTSDYSSGSSTASSLAQRECRLAYGLNLISAQNKLKIRVIQLGNFHITEPDGAMAPYVKICVYKIPKQFFSFGKQRSSKELTRNHLESETQTKIQRRTANPIFNETYEISVNSSDIGLYTIKFLICDFDKYSRHLNIGEVICDLCKVDLLSGEEVLFNDLLMEPQEEDLGELHISLMYLLTSEKLSLTVMEARGLKIIENPKRNIELYTKITLMFDGRPLKKIKTVTKSNEPCLVFNETFIFDVPVYQLDKVYFTLAVIEVDKDAEESSHLLGRLYIGVNFDDYVKAHWLEMVQKARKQVACWHYLQS